MLIKYSGNVCLPMNFQNFIFATAVQTPTALELKYVTLIQKKITHSLMRSYLSLNKLVILDI